MFCLVTDLHKWQAYPAGMLAAAYRGGGTGRRPRCAERNCTIRSAGPSAGPIFRSRCPDMIRPGARRLGHRLQSCVRAAARAAALSARPRPARAAGPGSPSSPRRSPPRPPPAAPRSPPPGPARPPQPARRAHRSQRASALCDLGGRRVVIDQDGRRDRKTKPGRRYPPAAAPPPASSTSETITVCGPLAAWAPQPRQHPAAAAPARTVEPAAAGTSPSRASPMPSIPDTPVRKSLTRSVRMRPESRNGSSTWHCL